VESYRSRQGKVRQRIVVNFGSIHRYSKDQVAEIIDGLKKFFQLDTAEEFLAPAASQDFGGTYAIFKLWDELGWSEVLRRHLRDRRYGFEVIVQVLVANRLLDPMGKLHILDWLEGVYLPSIDRKQIDYNHLLRAMDFLIAHKRELEPALASPLLNLFDRSLDLVFYDLTSCYFEIDAPDKSRGGSTLRHYGYDRDCSGCPQVVLGLVLTKDGIPLCHYVFSGETPDKTTLQEVVEDLKERFAVKCCVVVGDRGLLSEENLQVLAEAGLDYIVARPLRGQRVAKRVIEAAEDTIQAHREQWRNHKTPWAQRQWEVEVSFDERRFVLCHHEEIARHTQKIRRTRLAKATSYVQYRVARTKAQHQGAIPRQGKALSYQETLLHLHDYLRDRQLGPYYRLWLDEQGEHQWTPNQPARQWETRIDGKLLLETTNRHLSADEVVHQYKELQEIERCFRTLKSSLDIRPVFHWVDRRIQAHIFICVMALQIQRLMRHRLQKANITRSPERVLEKLSFQRTVEAQLKGRRVKGLVPPTAEQLSFFEALNIPEAQHKDLSKTAM